MKGRAIILSGPSGVGKDTLIDAWMAMNPRLRRVVTYTTRAPREGEVNGVNYHFVSREEFMRRANAGEFLEWKEVHGNLYASPLKDLHVAIDEGLFPILKIDVQGARAAMPLLPDALTVFILPPSDEELETRIRARATDTEEQIATRLKNAHWEISLAGQYAHRVVNDDVSRAVSELESLL